MNVIGFNDGNLIQSGLNEECIAMVDTFDDIIKFLQLDKKRIKGGSEEKLAELKKTTNKG